MATRANSNPALRSAPPFDQGLFLLHLNRGKEEMKRGQWDAARHELEEAQRLRPDNPEVGANLAFALFHLGHFEEAERRTTELLKKYPKSLPLLFNQGLILFKSGRAAEARPPLEMVLELNSKHRKANLLLGLILQREGRTQEALRHLRMAGAERKPDQEGDDTVSRTARAAVIEVSAPKTPAPAPVVKPESFESPPEPSTSTRPVPVSTARVRREVVLPPRRFSLAEMARSQPVGAFAPRPGGFLVANCADGLWVRRGVLAGRSGAPTFDVDRKLGGALARTLVHAGGGGTVLLLDRGRQPFLRSLEEEFLSVDPSHVLGFEETLVYREDPAFEFRRQVALPFLKLYGTGAVALAAATEPARFEVEDGDPLTLTASTVIAYGGEVHVDLMEGADPLAEFGSGPVLRFSGVGFVLAEGG